MEWFKHKTTACRDQRLRRVEMSYGFAGIGFYWKLYEQVMLNNDSFPLEEALSWARRDFPQKKARSIIYDFGLFAVDDLELIHIANDEAMTEDEMSVSEPAVDDQREAISVVTSSKKCEFDDEVSTKNEAISVATSSKKCEFNDEVSTKNEVISSSKHEKNDEQSPSNAPARIEETRIDKKEESSGIKRVRQMLTLAPSPEEKRFYEGMLEKCPHVCMMREPLTYQQFLQLRARYPTLHVGEMMQQMENYSLLNKKYRSAYLTLSNWMRREVVDSG